MGVAPEASAFEVLQVVDEVGYDIVLMETAALTDSAEALNVAAMAGVHTVMVGKLRETSRDVLADAMQMLDRVKAHVVGSVIFEK